MRLTDRLTMPQRIVVVIALGLALGAVATYLVADIGTTVPRGWVAYAPLSSTAYAQGTGLPGWTRLLIWLAAIALWGLLSLLVLRPSREAASDG